MGGWFLMRSRAVSSRDATDGERFEPLQKQSSSWVSRALLERFVQNVRLLRYHPGS